MHPKIYLRSREDTRILHGHPWIYDNEISHDRQDIKADIPIPAGSEVLVYSSRNQLLGSGIYNPHSHIRVRLFSRHEASFDAAFIRQRVMQALDWRKRYMAAGKSSFRLIYGESDGLPGLIVDAFRGTTGRDASPETDGVAQLWLSMQCLALGVEQKKAEIIAVLRELLQPAGIVERSEATVRELEGLEPFSGIVYGTVPETIHITENDLTFEASLLAGQKTGWFLDQKENRALVAAYAKDAVVLDAFCNAGGFSVNCLKAGARSVLALDSSQPAIDAVRHNAEQNGFSDKLSTVCDNAFDYLRTLKRSSFDLVILDPPAFAKSKSSVPQALKGYKEINLRAMRALKPGGMLATFSCSYWLKRDDFLYMLNGAAADAGVRLRIVRELRQDVDHPISIGYDESFYLKGFLLEVQHI